MTRTRHCLALSTVFLSCVAGLFGGALSLGGASGSGAVRAEGADAVIAAYLAANCAVNESRIGLDSEEQFVLDQTNAYRAANGLGPLRLSAGLQRAAAWKSADLAVRSYMAHDDGFRSWEQRFVDCGYDYMQMGAFIAENLAAGSWSGGTTLQQWVTSPIHDANLLNPAFTVIGIKRVQAVGPGDPYGWYWAMEFGSDPGPDSISADQWLCTGRARHTSVHSALCGNDRAPVGRTAERSCRSRDPFAAGCHSGIGPIEARDLRQNSGCGWQVPAIGFPAPGNLNTSDMSSGGPVRHCHCV